MKNHPRIYLMKNSKHYRYPLRVNHPACSTRRIQRPPANIKTGGVLFSANGSPHANRRQQYDGRDRARRGRFTLRPTAEDWGCSQHAASPTPTHGRPFLSGDKASNG